MANDLIVVLESKVKGFIETRRDFDQAFQLDLNHDRLTTKMIWEAVKKARAMSNLVCKYLADTELLEKNLVNRQKLAFEALEDAVLEYTRKMPAAEYDRFTKDERRRIALMANAELRAELQSWTLMVDEVKGFKKTLELALENIKGARKDILGAIGAAKLENSWEPGVLGKDVNLAQEALSR